MPHGRALSFAAKRQKDLILFVRSRHCGELNRGLENLEAPCKGTFFGTFCIVQKVIKKHARTHKKLPFSAHAKPTDKEKPFLSTAKLQFSTAPKLTCSYPFRIPLATVSLQKALSFSKLRSLASALRLPFRTDSKPHRRYPGSLQSSAQPVT